ncbi:MAG: recombinase RecA, partial [Deltaproteobacteria bacterium]|nr:recombinase RecA [Deltaproteobacteria bacterium]
MVKKKKENGEHKQLEEAISEIQQRFGEGSIMRLKDAKPSSVDFISTGSISLDLALGIGGVPRGRVTEIYGSEMSGKTTLALHILANAQKMKGVAAFVDAEHALDPDYAKRIGVNVDELLISQPDSGEQALQIVETLIKSGEVDVIVIDSVAALVPQAEIAGEMGEFQIGLQARLMSQALRKLAGVIAKTKTSVIFLNQTRMKIGQRYGNPETTPGGLALKFYASVRINLRRIAQIKHGDEIIGNRTKA